MDLVENWSNWRKLRRSSGFENRNRNRPLAHLKAARVMDLYGNKEARTYISQIKVYVPNITLKIIDRAIQMYGGTGVSQWTPLAGCGPALAR